LGETLVRLEGAQELILQRLTGLGIYKTKSEAIRAGVLELGEKYNVLKSGKELEYELVALKMKKEAEEIKAGRKRCLTEAEVKKKYGFK